MLPAGNRAMKQQIALHMDPIVSSTPLRSSATHVSGHIWKSGKKNRREKGIAWQTKEVEYTDEGVIVVSVHCDNCQSREHNDWDCPDKSTSE